ncbi:uncharacterized protein LOC123557256 [Mercenaria mercenaria]|uniref:uncharacterized protein LOC123557256 n=1 Tax=Mercenaria mercenaria TaxID=6596 RepID=UPI00234F124B|nr:uncharacterized protein LOC123557256 [Mercenaria mercenaria]
MLRSVCFKNYVKFEEEQLLDFQNDGPFIFIGENGSGKSSVLERIRRCLKLEFSTSVSSSPNSNLLSYFICNFEMNPIEDEHIICGIVSLPGEMGQSGNETKAGGDNEIGSDSFQSQQIEKDMETEDTLISTDKSTSESRAVNVNETVGEDNTPQQRMGKGKFITSHNSTNLPKYDRRDNRNFFKDAPVGAKGRSEVRSYYKFALKYSANSQNVPMYINFVDISKTSRGETELKMFNRDDADGTAFKEYMDSVIKHESDVKCVEEHIQSIFGNVSTNPEKDRNDCNILLGSLSREVVFTFSLRSIGPLQWSESKRFDPEERENNYDEAEKRCEIIKCFLEDNNKNFDKEKEQEYFKYITQLDDYHFEMKDGKISLPKGKYALLKTPEGILEAKAVSILMSSKIYRTLILEEPDRGMHPQFIERMLQILKQKKLEKRVILTTHSTTLISAWTVPDSFIFRRDETECRIISGRSIVCNGDHISMKNIRLFISDHISDILFARRVFFYEGDSELLFFTEFRHQILAGESQVAENLCKEDEDSCNKLKKSLTELTFIKMNGKDKVEFCQDVSKKLQLEHIFLVDRDAVTRIRQKGKNKIERKEEEDAKSKRKREDWLNIRKEFLSNDIFFWLDGRIEDMVKEIYKNNDTLRDELRLAMAGDKLFLHKDCDDVYIKKSVKLILAHCEPKHELAEFIKILKRD